MLGIVRRIAASSYGDSPDHQTHSSGSGARRIACHCPRSCPWNRAAPCLSRRWRSMVNDCDMASAFQTACWKHVPVQMLLGVTGVGCEHQLCRLAVSQTRPRLSAPIMPLCDGAWWIMTIAQIASLDHHCCRASRVFQLRPTPRLQHTRQSKRTESLPVVVSSATPKGLTERSLPIS